MKICISILIFILLFSCKKEKQEDPPKKENKVLLLMVNYFTYQFEGGAEVFFTSTTTSIPFILTKEFQYPLDFGYLKFKYQAFDDLIFHGSMIWMGYGEIKYPQNIVGPEQFDTITTNNVIPPPNNFDIIFNFESNPLVLDSTKAWDAIKKLQKVKEYTTSNPHSTMKIFPYIPTMPGFTFNSKWIILLKN